LSVATTASQPRRSATTGTAWAAARRIAALACLSLLVAVAQADERILGFHSDIAVFVDGGMRVVETITVRAEGNQIRRGIYRDFPTDYRDRLGNRYRVGFDVVTVMRDGKPEPYFTERISNGVRVYVGDANVLLRPGEYAYEITYRTNRQLGFFDDHDELYWNVTGNGWDFPIDRASAVVSLPMAPVPGTLMMEGYVGPMGSTERSYAADVDSNGTATIASTRPLLPREGLTLVASWPKGLIHEPTAAENTAHLLNDNRGLLVAVLGYLGALGYLIYAWSKVGRDPVPGVIFPHYTPPEGFSPAAMRYVTRMGYDNKSFTAAVLNLAVKGYVEIDKTGRKYVLRATRQPQPTLDDGVSARAAEPHADKRLAHGEKAVLESLFSEVDAVELDNDNHAIMRKAIKAHTKSLDREYNRIYFVHNFAYVLPAALILGIAFLIVHFLAQLTVSALIVLVPAALTILVFVYLLRAPTPFGRKLLDKIEGFRLYLDVAERDDLAAAHPPEKTPALFEAYLPYALALGVEQAWAEQFAEVFDRIKETTGQSYQPIWYHGRWRSGFFGNSVGNFTKMTSALNGAISSASTPPGSSSGAGGGGSSGGGGGGGGGGGW
jgi:uncharacterized membrane protein YgcG